MTTGAGTPSSRPVESCRKPASNPEIGRPAVKTRAPPRAMLIMPRVAMKAGRRPLVISMPFTRPQVPPTAMPAAMAAPVGQPARNAAASTTPASASSEPTERSMPPERITKVIPTAITALMLVCSATLSRLETDRKCGVSSESNAARATSPTSVPSSRARRAAVAPVSTRPSTRLAQGEGEDLRLRGARGLQLGHDPSFAHHQHAVAHAQHLRQLGGDHQDALALRGQAVHEVVDLHLRRHVDAARGLVDDQHVDVGGQPFPEHVLLLVASREQPRRLGEAGRLEAHVAHPARGQGRLRGGAYDTPHG